MGRPRLPVDQRKIQMCVSLKFSIAEQARLLSEDDNVSKLVRELIVSEWKRRMEGPDRQKLWDAIE